MKITSVPLDKAVSDGPIDAFSHVVLGDSPTLDEVLDCLASLHVANPRHRYLCTLDDVGQCRYTSMHASDDERIALYEEDDPITPEDALAARERLLAHVVAQLEHSSHRLEWTTLPGTLLCNDETSRRWSRPMPHPTSSSTKPSAYSRCRWTAMTC